jgi:lsr operon transcriptional repressor
MNDRILSRVAVLYYQHEMTHAEIARELGWNRVKVTRALKEARNRALIEFVIHDPVAPYEALEQRLMNTYGLQTAKVGPSFDDRRRSLSSVGRVGAVAMAEFLPEVGTVAVGMSTAVAATVAGLGRLQRPHLDFVATTGSVSKTSEETSAALAAELARRVGGAAYTIPGPLRSSPEMVDALSRDPAIASAISMAEDASHLIVGIGSMQAGGGRMRDSLGEKSIAELLTAGAVGDVAARFFNVEGKSVNTSIDNELLALDLESALSIPRIMVVAAGAEKVVAISSLLNRGRISDLVVDADLARALITDSDKE